MGKWLFYIIPFLGMMVGPQLAMANLQVYPTGLIFTPGEKMLNVSVRNRSEEKKTYIIRMDYLQQKSQGGGFDKLEKPEEGAFSATPITRFSPRKVTLEPRQDQLVKVMMSPKADAPKGDYRGYVTFEEVQTEEKTAEASSKGKSLKMNLAAKMAISIAAVYDDPDVTPNIKVSNLKVTMNPDKKTWKFSVDAENSVEGSLGVLLLKFKLVEKDGKTLDLGFLSGIPLHAPKVSFEYDLPNFKDYKIESGTIRVGYHNVLGKEDSEETPELGSIEYKL